jgi:hypothetical protein
MTDLILLKLKWMDIHESVVVEVRMKVLAYRRHSAKSAASNMRVGNR